MSRVLTSSRRSTGSGLPELPLLMDLRHRAPIYICCVRDPMRHVRRVFLWMYERPRGRGAAAPKTFTTLHQLRKALQDMGAWPDVSADVEHVSTSTSFTSPDNTKSATTQASSSSSHASLYVRMSTLSGMPLTTEAVSAITAWATADEPCTFTVVYEPVLRMATMRVWMHRLASTHTHTTLSDVHTWVPIAREADAMVFVHDLVDTVLAVKGPISTRSYRRQHVLRTNLEHSTLDWPSDTLQRANECIRICTHNEDHPTDQQALYDALWRPLASAIKNKRGDIRHRLTFDDASNHWYPFDVARARSNMYGFFHVRDDGDHTRTMDRIIADLPSTVVYATQTHLAYPQYTLIDSMYTQEIQTPLVPALRGEAKQDEFMFQMTRGYLRAHLNRTRMPVLLYQLYNQLRTSSVYPILALYHQTPGLARRILRIKYREREWDPRKIGRRTDTDWGKVPSPTHTLLDVYVRYIETQNSRVWMEADVPDVAHFLDVVLFVKPYFYLCVLDSRGTMDIHMIPWHKTHKLQGSSLSLSTSVIRFVQHALPRVNRWIHVVNQVRYPVAIAGLQPGGPDLAKWTLSVDEQGQWRAGPHVHLQRCTLQSRFLSERPCVLEALQRLRYAFFPSPVTTGAFVTNPPASLRQRLARLGHTGPMYDMLRNILGSSAHTDEHNLETHGLRNKLYLKNNQTTPCTLLVRTGCPRFDIDERSGHNYLSRGVPLLVNVQESECQTTMQPPGYQLPKHEASSNLDYPIFPVHPSVVYEFCVLLAYSAHLFQRSPAWPRLRKALLATHNVQASTNVEEDDHQCHIPVIAAPHGDRLSNIKETMGHDLYKRHLTKCASEKGRYNRVCQKDNQPWCVPASTTASFRRWCRYACVPPLFDVWASADVRQRLRLHNLQTVFRGPYRIQYATHKSHTQLTHNLFKMQRLKFYEATCDVLKTTLLRLILECNRIVHPQAQNPNVVSEDIRLEWYKKAVHDSVLLRQASKMYAAAFSAESLPDLREWVRHYGKGAATWRMWVHIAQRFAQTLYYLPHPFLRTASRDTIHFCCPEYLCGHCKVPMASPETPAYYYADPPTVNDIREAMQHGGTNKYQGTSIAEVAIRRRDPAIKDPLDYRSGDDSEMGVNELVWAHMNDASVKTAHTCPPRVTLSPLYGEFGTVLPLHVIDGMTLRTTIRFGGTYDVCVNAPTSASSHVRCMFTKTPGQGAGPWAAQSSVYVIHHAEGYTVSTTEARPLGAKHELCTDVPTTFEAQMECLPVRTVGPDSISSTIIDMNNEYQTDGNGPAVVVIRTGHKSAVLVHRPSVPLCVRFRQLRAIDPLKTLLIPHGYVKQMSSKTTVVLTGMAQYAASRIQKTNLLNKRYSRKQRRNRRNMQKRPTTRKKTSGGASRADGEDAHTIRVPLSEALKNGLVACHCTDTLDANEQPLDALTLCWGLCREWALVLGDNDTFVDIANCNRKRTSLCAKKATTMRVPLTQLGLSIETSTRMFTMHVNDDRRYECPKCGRCNHVRTYYHNYGAMYGQIVGLKKVPTVGTDPDWMYVSSYKAASAALNPQNYERLWNRAPDRSHNEYLIPLGLSTVAKSTRPKAFNCNVQKVTRTDTFTVQSFNLHTLLEQPSVVGDKTGPFVITGTVPHNASHTQSSLHSLWECVTEETIDEAWFKRNFTDPHVLNLAGGRFARSRVVSTSETRRPRTRDAIQLSTAYLCATLQSDTGLTGDLLYWWEIIATLGYDPRNRYTTNTHTKRLATPISLFILDIRQTQDGNNFSPRVMAPPHGHLGSVLWDPFAVETPSVDATDNAIHGLGEDLVLFSVALKVQCSATYADAFYVLRASTRTSYAPIFVCRRSRVKYFLLEGVSTFEDAKVLYRTASTTKGTPAKTSETEQMYMSALLYCKLYKNMVDALVYQWYIPPSNASRPIQTGKYVHITPAVLSVLVKQLATLGFVWRNHVCVNDQTFQVSHLVFWKASTEFRLPVASMAWTPTCIPFGENPTDTHHYVSLEEADTCLRTVQTLHKALRVMVGWTVHSHVVDAFGRVTALQLANGGSVPVIPTLMNASPYDTSTIATTFQHATSTSGTAHTRTHDMCALCHTDYTHIWSDFMDICDALATYFQRESTAFDTTCKPKGSVVLPCELFRMSEQLDKLLRSPPSSLPSSLRKAICTDRKYVRTLHALFEQYVLYPDASTVRRMIMDNQTLQLRKLFHVQYPRQTSADSMEAVCAQPPSFDFPASRTQVFYETQHRRTTDILYNALLKRRDTGRLYTEASEESGYDDSLGFLPMEWQETFPLARLVRRDGFTLLAESTGLHKSYLDACKGKRLLPLTTVSTFLKFPIYLLNEHRVIAPSSDKTPSPNKGLVRGPVMYVRTINPCYRARVIRSGMHTVLQTPDFPGYLVALWKLIQAEDGAPGLRIVYHEHGGRAPVACTVNKVTVTTSPHEWHTLTLTSPLPSIGKHVASMLKGHAPTWQLDPSVYHVARYHLIKTKLPNKPKLKNLQPESVAQVLGDETPWMQISKTKSNLRYYAHV